MKRATALTGILILALAATSLPLAAKDRGDGPRGHRAPHFDFSAVDADGDGRVTQDELQAHADARFAAADTDGDGTLSVEEMLARMEQRRAERLRRGAERMIARMDENGDGVLQAEEMGPRDESRLFARLDSDEDGAISQEELDEAREKFRDRRHGGDRGHRDGKGWKKHGND
ncbi:RNA polymerase sigma-70 factor [Pseudooceanicola batsensis HTCC2597]|uniref:RNA polymerase sigma-70 factor n=1 Tax=Pseudooceanicola batsensis (strain ATCC BAA-863 / DSM 15984 / KCTC 12145 / HTCC2597) TaxID=252305 RepID=A3U1Y8_PSEBH|nr:EF-hand domain-containing protein [Pseudooceanicola batsensis]EAQ01922.1 RNA polymerase sigma-70 factor [Pseudooceanicola batsensis HTCC2597]